MGGGRAARAIHNSSAIGRVARCARPMADTGARLRVAGGDPGVRGDSKRRVLDSVRACPVGYSEVAVCRIRTIEDFTAVDIVQG